MCRPATCEFIRLFIGKDWGVMVDALKANFTQTCSACRLGFESIRNATLISIKSMFKKVEMQTGAHFTIVCIILLTGVGSKIQENFAKQHVYEFL